MEHVVTRDQFLWYWRWGEIELLEKSNTRGRVIDAPDT